MNDGYPTNRPLTPLAIAKRIGLWLLDTITGSSVDAAADLLVIHDLSTATNKKITPDELTIAQKGVTADSTYGTDNVLVRSDGTGRKSQATAVTVDDNNNVTTAGRVQTKAVHPSVAVVTTAAGTTTLDTTSAQVQVFTGSTTQTVQLPAANALGSGVAVRFLIANKSTGTVTVQRAGSDTLYPTSSSIPLGEGDSYEFISDGVSEWYLK